MIDTAVYQPQQTSLAVSPNTNYLGWYNSNVPNNSLPYNYNFNNPNSFSTSQLGTLNTGQNNGILSGIQKGWNGMDFGSKLNTVFGGLQTLGSLYGSIKSIGLAEKQLAQQREQWNKTWGMAVNQHNEGVSTRAANKYNQNRDYASREYQRNKVEK